LPAGGGRPSPAGGWRPFPAGGEGGHCQQEEVGKAEIKPNAPRTIFTVRKLRPT
jgi:hypothetical protein